MTTWTRPFGPASLRIDAELETAKITASLTGYLAQAKRRGVVVALSGVWFAPSAGPGAGCRC
jgi:hypothetical protein